jgi:hypothetical protein
MLSNLNIRSVNDVTPTPPAVRHNTNLSSTPPSARPRRPPPQIHKYRYCTDIAYLVVRYLVASTAFSCKKFMKYLVSLF